MSSYVVTGASRGIGFEFLRQLSSNPANTVIGMVRDVQSTEAKVKAEFNRSNVHLIHGDLDSYELLKKASEATAKITGGSLDYLISVAARLPEDSHFVTFGEQGKNPAGLEKEVLAVCKSNVVGTIHLFNLFTPLILKGQQKKVIAISSGFSDPDLVSKYEMDMSGPYSVGKAAANMVVTKFGAEYARQGVLFMSICPGVVDTGHFDPAKLGEKELQSTMALMGKFQSYAPNFKGPVSPEESVKDVISVYEKASVANGDAGTFVSHFGNKQWL